MSGEEPGLVSVLMTVYNGGAHLAPAVESVLNQRRANLQFVIVDDGSTDGTAEYLDRLADPRVEVVHQANGGTAAAANHGLRQCRGEFLARMDADDVSLPDRFARQVRFLTDRPEVGLVGSQVAPMGARRVGRPIALPCDHRAIFAGLMEGRHVLAHSSIMLRTTLLKRLGGYWPYRLIDDVDMMLRMGEQTQLANLPVVLHHYRVHGGSLSGTRMRAMRSHYDFARDRARRRQALLPEIDYDQFLTLQNGRSWWSRQQDAQVVYGLSQYRRAVADLYGYAPWRGYARLAWAAACLPDWTWRRLKRQGGMALRGRSLKKKQRNSLSYVSKLVRGDFYPGQLMNLVRSRALARTPVVPWQPVQLSIFLTSRCNLRCDMCPTHSRGIPEDYAYRHRAAPDATLELVRTTLARYPNALRLSLHGTGEPLLNPNLFEMVREGKKRRMIVDVVSNGYALGEHVDSIVQSHLDQICISLNGPDEDEFHRMTGNPKHCYGKIVSNVEALLMARAARRPRSLRVEVSFVIDRQNYRRIGDMIAVAEGLGVESVALRQFHSTPYPSFTREERCLYADEPGVYDELKRLASRRYRCEVSWPFLLRREPAKPVACAWPWITLEVDGAGDIGGCPNQLFNLHDNGSIYDEDPWNNEYFRDMRRRQLKSDLLSPCRACVDSVGMDPTRLS